MGEEIPSHIRSIVDKVRAALSRDSAARGERVEQCTIERVTPRPYSTVAFLKVQFSSSTRRYVVKTIAHHPVNKVFTDAANQAVVEHTILSRLAPLFAGVDHCRVPTPILVLPEVDTYVMEFVDGELLTSMLRYTRPFSSKRHFAKLQQYMHLCGQWLKHLHGFTGIRGVDVSALNTAVSRTRHRLQLIEQHWPEAPRSLRENTNALIETGLSQLAQTPVLVSGRHGDYDLNNMLAGDGRLTVIDFLGFDEDSICIDILNMLFFLEGELLAFSSSKRRIEELRDSFLRGYGPLPRVPTSELLICEAMHRMVRIWGQIASRKDLYHRMQAKRIIGAHVRWFLRSDRTHYLESLGRSWG